MRELTEKEKLFIQENFKEHAENNVTRKISAKNKRKKLLAFINLKTLAYCFYLAPFILCGVFMYFIIRAESMFGKENLDLMSQQKIQPDLLQELERFGLSDLPQYLEIYHNRGLIIATIFTIFIILGTLCILLNYWIEFKRTKQVETE